MLDIITAQLTEPEKKLYRLLEPLIQPILDPLADPEITEIFVYRPERIVCRRRGRDEDHDARFRPETLRQLIQQLGTFNARRIGFGKDQSPILEGILPCGSRVSGMLKGVNADADALTIRKHTKSLLTPADLIDLGSITPEALDWLRRAIESDQSILISGATDSGKTTFLNVLAQYLPIQNRILVCEDTPELQIDKPNVARFRTDPNSGIGFLELLDLCMRQSGDHIIFGEIRAGQQTRNGNAGSPAFPFVMALNSGHRCSMTTIHANGGRESLEKFVNYCFFSGPTVPEKVFRSAVAEAFGVVVQLKKLPGERRKVVASIARVEGVDRYGDFVLEDVFSWAGGKLRLSS